MFQVMERKRNGSFKCSSNIFNSKRHLYIRESPPRTYKSHLVLILGSDVNLIVSKKSIHEGEYFSSCTLIDNMVNEGCGEVVFWTSLVQISEIHTNAYGSFLFINGNGIRNPFNERNRINKTFLEKLFYHNLYSCFFLGVH